MHSLFTYAVPSSKYSHFTLKHILFPHSLTYSPLMYSWFTHSHISSSFALSYSLTVISITNSSLIQFTQTIIIHSLTHFQLIHSHSQSPHIPMVHSLTMPHTLKVHSLTYFKFIHSLNQSVNHLQSL